VRDEEGCIIYEDRPTTCRYYPLGVATLQHKEGADDEGFFFMIQEPHCKGFEEDREWTVRAWREDQGVDLRDEVNAEWTDLLVRKRSFPASIKLTDQAKQMFFMVSYNLDKFRQFVFESTFLERFEVDEEDEESHPGGRCGPAQVRGDLAQRGAVQERSAGGAGRQLRRRSE
jgi:hypothetical protein